MKKTFHFCPSRDLEEQLKEQGIPYNEENIKRCCRMLGSVSFLYLNHIITKEEHENATIKACNEFEKVMDSHGYKIEV